MSNPRIGSDFDDFLKDKGIREEVTAAAIKRVIAWQLAEAMKRMHITKTEMAARMHTSRAETFENLTFLSFPRKRESMKPLKGLDSCFRRNDDLLRFGRTSKVSCRCKSVAGRR